MVPLAVLPHPVALWTVFDALCLIFGLLLLDRHLGLHGMPRALFWLLAAFFPPVFADVYAGQWAGLVLLCGLIGIVSARRHPWFAGGFIGAGGALKFYPLLMAAPTLARRRLVALATLVSFVALTVIGSLRVGLGGDLFYLRRVLLPSLGSRLNDCSIDSVHTLWGRLVGGEVYGLPAARGIRLVSLPWHFPQAALAATALTLLAVVVAAALAAAASGWNLDYSLALGLALGALLPGEVYPYQWLPLLPVTLLVSVRALEAGRWRPLALIGICLMGFVRPPCELLFPDLWTLSGLAIYAIVVSQYRLFKSTEG